MRRVKMDNGTKRSSRGTLALLTVSLVYLLEHFLTLV